MERLLNKPLASGALAVPRMKGPSLDAYFSTFLIMVGPLANFSGVKTSEQSNRLTALAKVGGIRGAAREFLAQEGVGYFATSVELYILLDKI